MRIFLVFFLLFFSFSNLYANDINTSCFYYFWNVKVDKNLTNYLLNSNKNIDFAKNENGEVYMKLYKQNDEKFEYSINWLELTQSEINSLKDNNYSSFVNYNIWWNQIHSNELVFDLKKEIWPNINAQVYIDSLNYAFEYYISDDWYIYQKINLNNLESFSFRYFKVKFVSKNSDKLSENIKIKDVIFSKSNYVYLLKWNSWENLNVYSSFFCSNDNDYFKLQSYSSNNLSNNSLLKYTSWLKQYSVFLDQNLTYDLVDIWVDIDWDLINDNEDNCKYDYNPNQLDSNTNWIWDLCDDDDWDWILWKNDNCPYISNRDQKDVNNNWVGDVCKFDKDLDWVFDSLDNCINTPNPNQGDSDRDWIWDACDNCNLYNPNQRDVNSNWVWDVCEETEKFALENDEDEDWVLDYLDNCKNTPNPDQLDTDRDWVWDVCDNCKSIKNPRQENQNWNQIWDMCEDVDWDSYLWYLDNCPYNSNPWQEDQNNNWIWDFCEDDDSDWILNIDDNCRYVYNPDQRDVDNDKIWDVCDKIDDRFIESNRYFFIWISIFFFLLFNFLIYLMFKKMKKMEKKTKK